MARRTLRKLSAAPVPALAPATPRSITVSMVPSEPEEPGRPSPSDAVAAPTRQRGAAAALSRNRNRNVTNKAELEDNLYRIHTTIHAERPMTTKRAYGPKQAEFRNFCQARGFQDRETVTESKLLLFLEKEVVYRPLRGPSRKLAPGIPADEARLH